MASRDRSPAPPFDRHEARRSDDVAPWLSDREGERLTATFFGEESLDVLLHRGERVRDEREPERAARLGGCAKKGPHMLSRERLELHVASRESEAVEARHEGHHRRLNAERGCG